MAYYGDALGEHHRYRSWEHCYSYFRRVRPDGLAADRDHAALQLAFYLASWGMYRGSSFLLQYAYTVHHCVIDLVAETRFDDLWNTDFGASDPPDVFGQFRAVKMITSFFLCYFFTFPTIAT